MRKSYTKSASDDNSSLQEFREEINRIDAAFLELLSQRRKMSLKCAEQKQQAGIGLRDIKREESLLQRSLKIAAELDLPSEPVVQIFKTIFEDSLAYQHSQIKKTNPSPVTLNCYEGTGFHSNTSPKEQLNETNSLAILGGKGAYSHLAAESYFDDGNNQYQACHSFEEIIQSVQQGLVNFGVIPIENTTSGGIIEVYDLLLNAGLFIIGENKIRIDHCLVAKPTSKLSDIETIAAHPQASRQCQKKLQALIPSKIELVESTAHAIDLVLNQRGHNTAAIACKKSAELFGLKVLHSELSDQKDNFTRFIVLSRTQQAFQSTDRCKTTIAISTAQKAGSLARALSLFSEANIPLTRLESRPIPNRPWEQMFYLDFLGNMEQPIVTQLFNQLSEYCSRVEFFGSYINQETYYEKS
jgi:chorismate mutase/prephenate dehydratase